MRLLIINSSPRRNGNISRLLEHAAQFASNQGAACEVINLHDKDIKPCIACMKCRKHLDCPINDDIHQIAEAISRADRIIIGAPCYWANMPGLLKMMFDRTVYLFITQGRFGLPQPLLTGKRALVVTASTTPMPFSRLFGQTSATVKSIHRILKMSGIKVIKSLQIGGTLNHNVADREMKWIERRIKQLLKQ